MSWKSIIADREIEDVKQDRRASTSVEQYKVSGQAVYFKGEYLPISEIESLRVQSSTYSPNCCCGKGIPVFKIRVDYGDEKPLVLMLEKEKNVEKMVSIITSVKPDITVEQNTAAGI